MYGLLHFIQNVDLDVYYWLSQFHGGWFLDRFVSHQESNILFKSGLLIAMYWYFWFREDRQQQQRRATILTILAGTILGLFFTRMVATFAPFRVRPLYDPNLHHYPLSFPPPTNFMNWSAFPSDHGAYLCALGFGLIWLSRRLTVPIVLYLAVWVCLPRLYLGIHYVSDIVVGAAIGVFTVWAALKARWADSVLTRRVLAFADAKPQFFYPIAFLTMFEMGTLFGDIRKPIRAVMRIIVSGPHHIAIEVAIVFLICICGVVAFLYRRPAPAVKELPSQDFQAKSARVGRH